MHEFSIADAILVKTLEISAANGGAPVERVRVLVGGLRQIVPEMLTFAFEALANDTAAKGAFLEIEEAQAQVLCVNCEHVFAPDELFWSCPACGAAGGNPVAGEELILQSVTLRDETADASEPSA
jgi:hydrogenase nickel incorporation protein HypA/HybF